MAEVVLLAVFQAHVARLRTGTAASFVFLSDGGVRRTVLSPPPIRRSLRHFLLLGGVEGGVVEQVEDGLAVGEGEGEELA